MDKMMTQDQRLSFLVEAFKADSEEYQDLATPQDTSGRQRILRSLMNIRMPGMMPEKRTAGTGCIPTEPRKGKRSRHTG